VDPSITLHRAAAAGFVGHLAALVVVDARAWRRTRRLRSGHAPRVGAVPTSARLVDDVARSSRSTFLASGAGLCLLGYGSTVRGGRPATAAIIAITGVFVTVAGVGWRVSALGVRHEGLTIRRFNHVALLPWGAITRIEPPRSFLGGWRISSPGGVQVLMPSDVLGNEWWLAHAIRAGGLCFSEGAWQRGPPARPPELGPRISPRA
jgi:hypothetical protein